MFNLKNKSLIKSAIIIAAILILSSLALPLRTAAFNIFKLPLELFTLVKREVSAIIFYHRNYTQNERLKKEIGKLKQKLSEIEEVSLENERLKNLLSFKQKSPYKMVSASVIARSSDSWSSVVVIDKGSINGIKRGFVAVTYLGLVGKVIEVTKDTSKVMLISDLNLGVSSIDQRSRQEGLVSGTLGGYLIMKYLPKESDIKIGDAVITSGLTENYPKGILIGTIVNIGDEFSGLSRYAVIKPAVNLSNIEELLVISQ